MSILEIYLLPVTVSSAESMVKPNTKCGETKGSSIIEKGDNFNIYMR